MDYNREDLVTYIEAAEILGITYDGIMKALKNKHLKGIKLPGIKQKYILRSAVLAYKGDGAAATPPPIDTEQFLSKTIMDLRRDIRATGTDIISQQIAATVALTSSAIGGSREYSSPKM